MAHAPRAKAQNTTMRVRTQRIGTEQNPVIVIDDMLPDAAALVDFAASQLQFRAPADQSGNFYPGLRAPVPRDYVLRLVPAIEPAIYQTFGAPIDRTGGIECFFAMATTPPGELTLRQSLPHVDTLDPKQLAVLHYLCSPTHGGTGFFRQVATGFETLAPERLDRYGDSLHRGLVDAGEPEPGYAACGTGLFETTHRFDAAFNRTLIYRSCMLHSIVLAPDAVLSGDPRTGRLTANSFVRLA